MDKRPSIDLNAKRWKRLEDLVWSSAQRTPTAIAIDRPPALGEVEEARQVITYADLEGRAKSLALSLYKILRSRVTRAQYSIGSEQVIAIAMKRDQIDSYIALLSVLEAGAAYLILDESFPLLRAQEMINDAQVVAVICDEAAMQRWAAVTLEAELIAYSSLIIAGDHESTLQSELRPFTEMGREYNGSELAYLIYTSGSTGRPKGVMIEHRNVLPLLDDDLEVFDLSVGDRVLQGSSHAYDSSVEEMFMAWSAGSTVVIGSDETMRLGPDLAPWLASERITLIAPPPTLLRVIGGAAISERLPELRYAYVGGEALPLDVAKQWSQHLTLVNGYGPTECAVTVTRSWISPEDEVVTIGMPHPGAKVHIVDEQLERVSPGEKGELLISGPALARGYLRRPELSTQRFPTLPHLGRVYRTGDLVSQRSDGQLCFHGRIDAQVKLRGYRLELGEVESALARLPQVSEVACAMVGEGLDQRLIAFYVPHYLSEGPLEDEAQCLSDSSQRLPDLSQLSDSLPHYMIPAELVIIESIPRLISGKIDRKALTSSMNKERESHQTSTQSLIDSQIERLRAIESPRSTESLSATESSDLDIGEESKTRRAFSIELLGLIAIILEREIDSSAVDDDFFELGGDSISAASLISHTRELTSLSSLTVRDIYQERSATKLVDKAFQETSPLGQREGERSRRSHHDPLPDISDEQLKRCTLWQGVWIMLSIMLSLAMGVMVFLVLLSLAINQVEWADAVGVSAMVIGLWLISPLLMSLRLLVAVRCVRAAKGLLIGRYAPGIDPIWSQVYVKYWLLERISRLIPWGWISGSPLHTWTLRQLGATIGERVYLHRGVDLSAGGWDLITISEGVTIGRDASLRPIEYERLQMRRGHIKIGAGASLGIRSGVSTGGEVGRDSILTDHSAVPSGGEISERVRASGACLEEIEAIETLTSPPMEEMSELEYGIRFHASQWVTSCLMSSPLVMISLFIYYILSSDQGSLAALPDHLVYGLWSPSDLSEGAWGLMTSIVLLSALSMIAWGVSLIYLAILCRWRGSIPLGAHPIRGEAMIIAWQKERLLIAANRWLSGTLFWPYWLRLAGLRVGPDSEVSTIMECVLEHTKLRGRCFSADGVYLAAPRIERGWIHFGETLIEDSVFLGNHSIVPAGATLSSETLLGVSTVYDLSRGEGSRFGHPSFELPRREVVSADLSLTHKPSALRYLNRAFWELGRGFIPVIWLLEAVAWLSLVPPSVFTAHEWVLEPLLIFRLAGGLGLIFAFNIALTWCLKWLLLGRVKPGQHPLWSCWCSRWDCVYVYWGELARPLLRALEGTLFLNAVLRSFGLTIGHRVFLGRGFAQVVDPDMLHFGNRSTVVNLFQAHSFEDRVLKTDHVYLGEGSSVGAATVVLYGADIGENTIIGEHSVVMKRERLMGDQRYSGAPSKRSN